MTRAEWIVHLEKTAAAADDVGAVELAATCREQAAINRELLSELSQVDERLARRLALINPENCDA